MLNCEDVNSPVVAEENAEYSLCTPKLRSSMSMSVSVSCGTEAVTYLKPYHHLKRKQDAPPRHEGRDTVFIPVGTKAVKDFCLHKILANDLLFHLYEIINTNGSSHTDP